MLKSLISGWGHEKAKAEPEAHGEAQQLVSQLYHLEWMPEPHSHRYTWTMTMPWPWACPAPHTRHAADNQSVHNHSLPRQPITHCRLKRPTAPHCADRTPRPRQRHSLAVIRLSPPPLCHQPPFHAGSAIASAADPPATIAPGPLAAACVPPSSCILLILPLEVNGRARRAAALTATLAGGIVIAAGCREATLA